MASKTTLNFITDFKNSGLIDYFTGQYTVIMIWLTGSRAIDLAGDKSDYDVGILVADQIESPRNPGRMTIAKYKKDEDRHVHFRINTLREVYSVPTSDIYGFYDYLGWSQFSQFTTDHLIYLNPDYQDLVDELISCKQTISRNAAFAFLRSFKAPLEALIKGEDISGVHSKFVAYFIFCLGILTNTTFEKLLLTEVKLTPFAALSEETQETVKSAANVAIELVNKSQPEFLNLNNFKPWW